MPEETENFQSLPGRGVDIGTANIGACHVKDTGNFATRAVRDCFMSLPIAEQLNLEVAGVKFFISENEEHLIILDREAAELSAVMGSELRRPLASGFISDKEDLSKEVVKLILESLLGKPMVPGELAVYSVPGEPVDSRTPKAQYHTRFFYDRIKELGFTPIPINEALAVCFNETMKPIDGYDPLTGLCFSFGAGMINVALVFKSICVRSFSLPMGGDWIDEAAAKATNSPLTQVTLLKEEGLNLTPNPDHPEYLLSRKPYHDAVSERQAEAVSLMYRELLTKLRDTLTLYFSRPENRVDIKAKIPVIVSGGTTMANGFLALFDEIVLGGFETRLSLAPHATQASNPLLAVAMGALRFARLRAAQQE